MKSFLKYQGKTSPKLRKAVIAILGDIESLIEVANNGAQGLLTIKIVKRRIKKAA